MKYLKRYEEAVGVRLKSELKSTVEDLLIDLRDDEFETKVSEIDYHSQKVKVKVNIQRDREFTYEDIKPQIESIWSYLNEEGFTIENFTSVEDWENFEEPEDEFTIHQKDKGYVWSTGEDGEIKSIDKEFQRRPNVMISPIYNPENFDRIQKWIFEISFTKDKIVVDRKRGHLTTNEELKPQTYISAADKLTKLGHIKRPEQLKSWAETIKQREIDTKHKMALEEAKKLGQFQLRFVGRGSEIRFANCYIQLYFNSDYYLRLQDVYINLTNQNCKDEDGVTLPMTPSGVVSIECSEFSEVYFANRREAIKFRNLLVDLFEGDIDYIQPNGKDFKEDIIETWCDHEERPVELSELEDFIDKLRVMRLNSLYRD